MRRGAAVGRQTDRAGSPGCAALLLILLACLAAGCASPDKPEDGRIPVAVTLLPMKEMAEAVGGERIAVTVVVPPGSEPHTFEPTPGQIAAISGSRLFFRVGGDLIPFEERLASRLLAQNPDLIVIDLSEGIDLIPGGCTCGGHHHDDDGHHHAGSSDPHIWLTPLNGAIMAETIAAALSAADPGGAEIYRQNLEEYRARIDSVDAGVRERLSGLKNRHFIVTHDAWGYFAREYDLRQVPVHIGGKEPTAREIQEIIRIAREEGIGIVCIEPQFPEKTARVIAAEIGGEVVVIDPLPEAYLQNFLTIADALGGA